jgi:hypothetical protein
MALTSSDDQKQLLRRKTIHQVDDAPARDINRNRSDWTKPPLSPPARFAFYDLTLISDPQSMVRGHARHSEEIAPRNYHQYEKMGSDPSGIRPCTERISQLKTP